MPLETSPIPETVLIAGRPASWSRSCLFLSDSGTEGHWLFLAPGELTGFPEPRGQLEGVLPCSCGVPVTASMLATWPTVHLRSCGVPGHLRDLWMGHCGPSSLLRSSHFSSLLQLADDRSILVPVELPMPEATTLPSTSVHPCSCGAPSCGQVFSI